jgi:hypothetical protein
MSQDQATAAQLSPTNSALRQATINAFEQQPEVDAQDFLDKLASSAAPAIGATVELNIAIWGKLLVDPDGQPWKYDCTVWGGPAYFGKGVGFMYTAYNAWDAFFQNVTSCHVQGIAEGGGILQVNWFISDATPVGQFNGAFGGIGLVQAGAGCKWQHK